MAKPIVHHKMRSLAYHESALLYNKKMAECARELVIADEMTDKEVKRWCMSQATQHEKHIPFHERAIRRLRKQKETKENKEKKDTRTNSKTRNRPRSGPPRKEGTDTNHTPARPIPRDPRLNKRPVVGTTESEKQEASV